MYTAHILLVICATFSHVGTTNTSTPTPGVQGRTSKTVHALFGVSLPNYTSVPLDFGPFFNKSKSFSPRNVKEYHSFSDMEIFHIVVPVVTLTMKMYFDVTSKSSMCQDSPVHIYYQYGAPPLPPHETFSNRTFTKRTNAGSHVITSGDKIPVIVSYPLPGSWFVGVLVPKSDGIKKISDFGFGKITNNVCEYSVGLKTHSLGPSSVTDLNRQMSEDYLSLREPYRIYKYKLPKMSKSLTVEISSCYSIKPSGKIVYDFCPLIMIVSAKRFPSQMYAPHVNCLPLSSDVPCSVTTSSPEQESLDYYIALRKELDGFKVVFNITAFPTACFSKPTRTPLQEQSYDQLQVRDTLDPACVPVQDMYPISTSEVLGLKFHPNSINTSVYLTYRQPKFFSFEISDSHIGSILGVHLELYSGRSYLREVLMCLQKDFPPTFYRRYYESDYSVNCSGKQGNLSAFVSGLDVYVPFPEQGVWYIGLGVQMDYSYSAAVDVGLVAETQACSNECSGHGTCETHIKADTVYGTCSCDVQYSGWSCEVSSDIDVSRVVLLCLSNMAFFVAIWVASDKRLFPEVLVYVFTVLASIFYHLCGSGVQCVLDLSFLQVCDFYGILISLWVTLIALVNVHNLAVHYALDMAAILALFIGVRKANTSVVPLAVTLGTGILLVLVSFAVHWITGRKPCYPSKKRWALFILPGTIMLVMSIIIFAVLETTENYKYVHSVGHVLLGLGIALLLPSRRGEPRSGHYNMVKELEEETSEEQNSPLTQDDLQRA